MTIDRDKSVLGGKKKKNAKSFARELIKHACRSVIPVIIHLTLSRNDGRRNIARMFYDSTPLLITILIIRIALFLTSASDFARYISSIVASFHRYRFQDLRTTSLPVYFSRPWHESVLRFLKSSSTILDKMNNYTLTWIGADQGKRKMNEGKTKKKTSLSFSLPRIRLTSVSLLIRIFITWLYGDDKRL